MKLQLELKQIIAEETTKLILENVEDCENLRSQDLDQIEKLFKGICDLFDEFLEGKESEITRGEEPVENTVDVPDGMSGIGGREMPGDIPSAQSHEVVAGDTFWQVARTY